MCDCDLVDQPDVYEAVTRKATKQHRCCECFSTINKNDQYVSISGLWEGKWSNFKQCLSCNQVMKSIGQKTDCCVGIGQLHEFLTENDEILEYEYIATEKSDYYIYESIIPWLRVVSQYPNFKCEVVQEVETE